MNNYSANYQPRTNFSQNQPTNTNTNAVLINSGLTDKDGARQVARRIL